MNVSEANPENNAGPAPLFVDVDCLSLKVPDLDEAVAFYSEKLGHRLRWRTATAAGFGLPRGETELVVHTGLPATETDLLVRSVPEAVERFTSAGGSVITPPIDLPVGLYAVVADPFGNRLSILDLSKGTYDVDDAGNVTGVSP